MTATLQLDQNVLSLQGDFDRFTLGPKALYRFPKATGALTLDLTKVTGVDTAGLAYILALLAHYEKNSTEVKISNIPEQLIALAQISNVLELLPQSSN